MKAIRNLILAAGLAILAGCGEAKQPENRPRQLAGHSYENPVRFDGLDQRFEKAELLFDLDKDGAKDQIGIIKGLVEDSPSKFTILKLYKGKANDDKVYITDDCLGPFNGQVVPNGARFESDGSIVLKFEDGTYGFLKVRN